MEYHGESSGETRDQQTKPLTFPILIFKTCQAHVEKGGIFPCKQKRELILHISSLCIRSEFFVFLCFASLEPLISRNFPLFPFIGETGPLFAGFHTAETLIRYRGTSFSAAKFLPIRGQGIGSKYANRGHTLPGTNSPQGNLTPAAWPHRPPPVCG